MEGLKIHSSLKIEVTVVLNHRDQVYIYTHSDVSLTAPPPIYQAVRPVAQAGDKNADFSPLALFAFFVNRCRENLHIIIAFSPIGDAFRNRMRQFPSLINCCTIDWFQVRESQTNQSDLDDTYLVEHWNLDQPGSKPKVLLILLWPKFQNNIALRCNVGSSVTGLISEVVLQQRSTPLEV